MKFKNKQSTYALLLVLLLALNVLLIKHPEIIRYNHSLDAINIKKNEIEIKEGKLIDNERLIEDSMNEFNSASKEKETVSIKASKMRSQITVSDFELHLSSLLINLEEKAISKNVDLLINYNDAKGLKKVKVTPDENMTEEILQNAGGADALENKVKVDGTKSDIESIGSVEIEGMNVATVPLSIEGSYKNVRDYVKYLDEVEMLEPTSVKISSSDGKTVKASIVISVFYGEVD